MGGVLKCNDKGGDKIPNAAATALADFKNPYVTSNAAVVANGKATTNGNAGMTAVSISSNTITIVTCIEEDCSTAANQKSNTVQVE